MKTQEDRIKHKLRVDGYVTRNEAIRNFITRLSAIILDLKYQGWDFKTEKVGGDYKYTLIKVGQ